MCPECGAELRQDETGVISCSECSWHCSIEDVT